MSRAFCSEGDHYPELMIADIPEELDTDGIGILVYGDGSATNRWADGTIGISAEQAVEAEIDDEPRCVEHPDCFVTWDHS